MRIINTFLLIIYLMLAIVAISWAQEELILDAFDGSNTEAEDLDLPAPLDLLDSSSNAVAPKGSSQLVTAFGVQNMQWNYNASVSASDSGGSEKVINETSSYTSLFFGIKYIHYKPFGVLAKLSLTLPLSIEEVINPTTTGNSAAVVSNTTYVLKNLDTDKNIGMGFEVLLGPNYTVSEKQISVNLGGGFAWKSYFEEIAITDRHVSAIGLGLDVDAQWHVKSYFGVTIGLKGEYYPFAIIERNNTIKDFTLKTQYLSTLGVYLGTSWYF